MSSNLDPRSAPIDMPIVPPRPKRSAAPSPSPRPQQQSESVSSHGHSSYHDPSPLNGLNFHPVDKAAVLIPSSSIEKDPAPVSNSPDLDHSAFQFPIDDIPQQPSNVAHLPTIGQEGSEYSFFEKNATTIDRENHHSPDALTDIDHPASLTNTTSLLTQVTSFDSHSSIAIGLGRSSTDTHGGSYPVSAFGSKRPSSFFKDDQEFGIPEIGVQIPLYPHAGDVQAPTHPRLSSQTTGESAMESHTATPELGSVPPGSYGRRGHGHKTSLNKFEKDWYDKHPDELVKEESYTPALSEHRESALSRAQLEALIHKTSETPERFLSTPHEDIAGLALDRVAVSRPGLSRNATDISIDITPPDDTPTTSQESENGKSEDVIHVPDSRRHARLQDHAGIESTSDRGSGENDGQYIPILAEDELIKRPESSFHSAAVSPDLDQYAREHEDQTPSISRTSTDSSSSQRRGLGIDLRQQVLKNEATRSTPLETLPEYEPLFPDDDEDTRKAKEAHNAEVEKRCRHQFPSEDVWEDSPNSYHLQTTVDQPDSPKSTKATNESDDDQNESRPSARDRDREREREREQSSDDPAFLPEHLQRLQAPKKEAEVKDQNSRHSHAFPSRDIWEDAADHSQLVTTIDLPHQPTTENTPVTPDLPSSVLTISEAPAPAAAQPETETEKKAVVKAAPPPIPTRLNKKPTIPERPKSQILASASASSSSTRSVPPPPPRPLPASARAMFSQASSLPSISDKPKPAIPTRPSGSKIAALKAGFMKDLNSKLQIGPQAMLTRDVVKTGDGTNTITKDELHNEEVDPEAVEVVIDPSKSTTQLFRSSTDDSETKAPQTESTTGTVDTHKPLADVRSGRARGPPRRQPTKPAATPATVLQQAPPEQPKRQTLGRAPVVVVLSSHGHGAGAVSVPQWEGRSSRTTKKATTTTTVPSVVEPVLEFVPTQASKPEIVVTEAEDDIVLAPVATVSEKIEPVETEETEDSTSTEVATDKEAKLDGNPVASKDKVVVDAPSQIAVHADESDEDPDAIPI